MSSIEKSTVGTTVDGRDIVTDLETLPTDVLPLYVSKVNVMVMLLAFGISLATSMGGVKFQLVALDMVAMMPDLFPADHCNVCVNPDALRSAVMACAVPSVPLDTFKSDFLGMVVNVTVPLPERVAPLKDVPDCPLQLKLILKDLLPSLLW